MWSSVTGRLLSVSSLLCTLPFRYCDGSSFTGDVSEPVVVPSPQGNKTIYYRGRRNLDAVLDKFVNHKF